jgi:LysM repeat protein
MTKRSSASARVIAVTALVCGVAVLLFVVATSLSNNGGSGKPAEHNRVVKGNSGGKGSISTSYVVQNGDTLTSIAHQTGVPVSQILKLNPGVDPQILISGEKLKLR